MSASLNMDGLEEMRAILRALPEELRQREFGPIAEQTAAAFAADLPSRYPAVEGELRAGVKVRKVDALIHQVRTTAPHAHLYEYGTIRRQTAGTGANRGVMPAQPTFVPWAIRWRARMVERLAASLRSLRVPGFEGTAGARES